MMSQSIKRLLAEIALLAAGNGLHQQLDIILSGLEKNGANPQLVALARGISLIGRSCFLDAIQVMQDARGTEEASLLDAFTGLACIRQGHAKRAEDYLQRADQSSDLLTREVSAGFRQLLLL